MYTLIQSFGEPHQLSVVQVVNLIAPDTMWAAVKTRNVNVIPLFWLFDMDSQGFPLPVIPSGKPT